jgi:hypothetical protein
MTLDERWWEEQFPRLTLYALKKIRRLRWQGPLPGGLEPVDMASTAVAKYLSGERRWNPQTYPRLEEFLCSVIDSEISHLINSWEHRHIVRPLLKLVKGESDESSPDPFSLPSQSEENKALHRLALKEFSQSLADDPTLQKFLALRQAGFKILEAARHLGITAKQAYGLQRKLWKALVAFGGNQTAPTSQVETKSLAQAGDTAEELEQTYLSGLTRWLRHDLDLLAYLQVWRDLQTVHKRDPALTEIAEQLGISPDQAQSQREKLKASLKDYNKHLLEVLRKIG